MTVSISVFTFFYNKHLCWKWKHLFYAAIKLLGRFPRKLKKQFHCWVQPFWKAQTDGEKWSKPNIKCLSKMYCHHEPPAQLPCFNVCDVEHCVTNWFQICRRCSRTFLTHLSAVVLLDTAFVGSVCGSEADRITSITNCAWLVESASTQKV